jgi:hypothetical protein
MTTSNNIGTYQGAIAGLGINYPNSPLANNQYTIAAGGTGLGIGQTQPSAFTITGSGGDAIITFHKDGRIETQGGTIQAHELTAVIKLMKRMMTDIANDEELSARFPYIKDAAYEWVMDELRK